MTMPVAITGLGMVSALGCGVDALRAGLADRAHPRIEPCRIQTARGPAVLPVFTADPEGLERYVPKRSLRRLDRFVRMALLASCMAAEDAALQAIDRTRIGIIFGSAYGPLQTTFDFQDSMIDFGDKCASPTHFANSVHGAPAAQVSMALGIEGPCQTLTCFEWTAISALQMAEAWLREGVVDAVLVGLGDEYCPVRGAAEAELGSGAENHASAIAPFDFSRCTHLPGEGFVSFVLEPAARVEARYGCIQRINLVQGGAAPLLASLAPGQPVFLAAHGVVSEAPAYRQLQQGDLRLAAHAPLYGGLPTGLGFELAVAALSIHDGQIHPTPGCVDAVDARLIKRCEPMPAGSTLACVAALGEDVYALISLEKMPAK